MSELRERLIQSAAEAIDDARCHLTRAYAANDPEIKAVAAVAVDAIMALIEQSRPSREEFERNVDLLLEQHESLICCYDRERPKQQRRVDERRREVMRMAGYPEER